MRPRRVLILGAAGRDFHNFNVVYRADPGADVVAFTATQIPGMAGRRYPPALAGPRYPDGIPIEPAEDLERLIRELDVDEVVLATSGGSSSAIRQSARCCRPSATIAGSSPISRPQSPPCPAIWCCWARPSISAA